MPVYLRSILRLPLKMSSFQTKFIIFQYIKLVIGLILLVYRALALAQEQDAGNLVHLEQSILEKLLNGSNYLAAPYEKPTRPLPLDECDTVTRIYVDMFIRSFDFMSDDKMEYRIQLTFRQSWVDTRLQFTDMDPTGKLKYLTLINSSQLWTPDTYFTNGGTADFHSILRPNNFVRVFSDGSVLSSARISTSAYCSMTLKSFPMDVQTCYLKVSSYGYTKDDLIYRWKSESPIQLPPTLDLAKFSVGDFETVSGEESIDESSVISLQFTMTRDRGFYKSQIFVPCIMLVLLGWFSLWISPFQPAGRAIVIMGTVLATTIVVTSFNSSTPRVSYLKASDVWVAICVLVIFSALMEYVLVHYLTVNPPRFQKPGHEQNGINDVGAIRKVVQWFCHTPVGHMIDFFSRAAYLMFFVTACVIFWYEY